MKLNSIHRYKSLLGSATLAIVSLLGAAPVANAVPADPRPRTFTQPDGSTITVYLRGDERGHFYLTEDNHLLVLENNTFYYGKVDADGHQLSTGVQAREASLRSESESTLLQSLDTESMINSIGEAAAANRIAKSAQSRGTGLFPGTAFPSSGTQKVLVVLVEYTNLSWNLDDPADYFTRMLTESGFSDYGATGSARDWFTENSRNQFTPQFDVYGPITLDHNRAYYGGNDWLGDDQRAAEMVIEACQQLDDEVDFSEYDRDNDGYIDNVYVFYAGQGEASHGPAESVWPHSWEVSAYTSTPYYFDGVRLDRYACSNEWESGKPDGIGTFVHEFSHVMGLPDLYATSYTSAFTPGEWSVMDYGPYNNDGRTPPNYSIYERYALDWIQPKVLDGPNTITLKHIASSNAGCIIPTEDPDEFFLLENRQQKGWDEYIPGHGLLIWHIDYDGSVWSSNQVNNSASHQYVDLEEADDKRDEYSRSGDSFPGTANKHDFTDETHPNMKTWAGKSLDLPITDITETDGLITFNVAGGLPDIFPVVLEEATDITPVSFKTSWSADENATEYLVSVYEKVTNNDRETYLFATGWNKNNVGNVLETEVTGLKPATTYYCTVYSSNGAFASDPSNEITLTTGDPTFDLLVPVATEATDIASDEFTANWEFLEGAEEYYISVYTKEREGEGTTDVCNFDDGIKNLPAGWTTNSNASYANSSYSGQAQPSLRLGSADAYIQTPTYPADIQEITFWHRGANGLPAENCFYIYAYINNSPVFVTSVQIETAKGGKTVTVEMPIGTTAARIEYHEEYHIGAVAIDDIEVLWNRALVNKPIEFYGNLNVGGFNTQTVTDLKPETQYYYSVRAFDGELFSKESNEISVKTRSKTTAIGSAITDDAPAAVYDMAGRLINSDINSLPAGVYIVKQGEKVHKVYINN